MCGRYTVLTEDEIIEIRGILNELSMQITKDDFTDCGNISGEVYPTNSAPIISQNDNGIAFESAVWGFLRYNGKGVIINARSETLRQKPVFSGALNAGRCIVPAGEFFEWDRSLKPARKYYAKDIDGQLLFMAGLYHDLPDMTRSNGIRREFVIITQPAKGEISRIHNRMPLLLKTAQLEDWLTGKLSPEQAMTLSSSVTIAPCDGQTSLF